MSFNAKYIKVFAPATVSNVGCGFDVMGFAIDFPGDELVLQRTENPGVLIKTITGDSGKLPLNPELNTAGKPILKLLEHFKIQSGIEIELHKKMPLGSGLGSSAASAVAAVFAFNKLFDLNLSNEELLPFAIEGEKIASGSVHADNVAPSLYGGFVLIRSSAPPDIIQIPVPEDLFCTVIHPHVEILTKQAREILPEKIDLSIAVKQWGNTAGLIAGMFKNDKKLISRSIEDFIIEPVRSSLIPYYNEIKSTAINTGALACNISGSGPSVFALSDSKNKANEIADEMMSVYRQNNIEADVYISSVNQTGPKVLELK